MAPKASTIKSGWLSRFDAEAGSFLRVYGVRHCDDCVVGHPFGLESGGVVAGVVVSGQTSRRAVAQVVKGHELLLYTNEARVSCAATCATPCV